LCKQVRGDALGGIQQPFNLGLEQARAFGERGDLDFQSGDL